LKNIMASWLAPNGANNEPIAKCLTNKILIVTHR
jgi:hypothetical protein